MLEIVKKKKVVKIGDDVYEMKSPTYKDSLDYQDSLDKTEKDPIAQAEVLFNYLEKLGMPKEVSKDLQIDDVIQIVKYLSGEKKTV